MYGMTARYKRGPKVQEALDDTKEYLQLLVCYPGPAWGGHNQEHTQVTDYIG